MQPHLRIKVTAGQRLAIFFERVDTGVNFNSRVPGPAGRWDGMGLGVGRVWAAMQSGLRSHVH